MRPIFIILGAAIGFIAGGIVGTMLALKYADDNPDTLPDNSIALFVFACIIAVGLTIFGGLVGDAIASRLSKDQLE